MGDRGEIVGPHGRVRVEDTQRVAERLIVHRGHVVEGRIAVNDAVVAQVDAARRYDTMRNHTATHLLHAALRRVLGTHVRQAGSLVTPDRLRFDFTHVEALKPEELAAVQSLVNDRIRADLPVRTRQSSFDDAMAEGVLAFFDEKYGDVVRIVETREDGERFSAELCGGTHCSSTGQIGLCLVVGESSIGAGMRRIEALTGRGAEAYVAERLAALQGASQRLGVTPQDLEPKLSSLLDELETARKQVQALERAVAAPAAAGLAERAQPVDGVAVLAARVEAPSQDALRHMGDVLRQRLGSAVIVLGATLGGRPDLHGHGHARPGEARPPRRPHPEAGGLGCRRRRWRPAGDGPGRRRRPRQAGRGPVLGGAHRARTPGEERLAVRILALDVGERRIGVAAADSEMRVALPVGVVERTEPAADADAIARLIEEQKAEALVLGLPISLNGSLGPQAQAGARLRRRAGAPTSACRWSTGTSASPPSRRSVD